MSARDNILNRVRACGIAKVTKPDLATIDKIRFKDKVAHFAEMVKAVGGDVVEMAESLEKTLAECGVDCAKLVSTMKELPQALNPDAVADVHGLGGEYAAVVRGKIGVAENGAVWIPVEGRRKAHLFACKHLVALLDRSAIVDTMHDAITHPAFEAVGYGAFISGPSKTADIEQALVMGAHGAMRTTIIII